MPEQHPVLCGGCGERFLQERPQGRGNPPLARGVWRPPSWDTQRGRAGVQRTGCAPMPSRDRYTGPRTHIHAHTWGCTQLQDAHGPFVHTSSPSAPGSGLGPSWGTLGQREEFSRDWRWGRGGTQSSPLHGHSPLESRMLRMKAHRTAATTRARVRKRKRRPQPPQCPGVTMDCWVPPVPGQSWLPGPRGPGPGRLGPRALGFREVK